MSNQTVLPLNEETVNQILEAFTEQLERNGMILKKHQPNGFVRFLRNLFRVVLGIIVVSIIIAGISYWAWRADRILVTVQGLQLCNETQCEQ